MKKELHLIYPSTLLSFTFVSTCRYSCKNKKITSSTHFLSLFSFYYMMCVKIYNPSISTNNHNYIIILLLLINFIIIKKNKQPTPPLPILLLLFVLLLSSYYYILFSSSSSSSSSSYNTHFLFLLLDARSAYDDDAVSIYINKENYK